MAKDSLVVVVFSGQEVVPYLEDLAQLRISVFREYPYLYDGDEAYERRYLEKYAASKESVFVLAIDGAAVVGVSTGVPLTDADEEFQAPFSKRGYSLGKIFYFGESVLDREYRGLGIGRRFMEERLDFAKKLGRFETCAFCAVERPENHLAKPQGYRPLDGFWESFGFARHAELHTEFEWKELGEKQGSRKRMVFWLKSLVSSAKKDGSGESI